MHKQPIFADVQQTLAGLAGKTNIQLRYRLPRIASVQVDFEGKEEGGQWTTAATLAQRHIHRVSGRFAVKNISIYAEGAPQVAEAKQVE